MPQQKSLHEMTPEELGRLFPICICEPDPAWLELFRHERDRISKACSKVHLVSLEHIGSTAIPGLKAKPTIDILMQIRENLDIKYVMDAFHSLDYHVLHKPENPPPHMMFVKGYTPEGFLGQAFHVHVRYPGDWNEIRFRDYLRIHNTIAKDYEALKIRLAKEYHFDREGYTEAKSDFIEKINTLARKELP